MSLGWCAAERLVCTVSEIFRNVRGPNGRVGLLPVLRKAALE